MRAWIFAALVMLAAAMSRENFETAHLRAGAAKVDVTPARMRFPGITKGFSTASIPAPS